MFEYFFYMQNIHSSTYTKYFKNSIPGHTLHSITFSCFEIWIVAVIFFIDISQLREESKSTVEKIHPVVSKHPHIHTFHAFLSPTNHFIVKHLEGATSDALTDRRRAKKGRKRLGRQLNRYTRHRHTDRVHTA